MRMAKRLDGVSESATLRLNALVQELKAAGHDVVNLTAGEPDFAVPEAAKQAVIEAVKADKSKYTPAAGIPELRKLVAEKTNAQQPSVVRASGPWEGKHVVVTNGGKQAIFNALLSIVDPGDEVLIPAPYWVSYPEMVKIAGGTPRIISTTADDGFKVSPKALKAALGPKAKAILLNSPSNPTGAMYSREEYTALGEVLASWPGVWAISDEIYDRITFGRFPFVSFLECAPGMRERVVTVNGMSKSAAMTGWRIGWSVAGPEATAAMAMLQGQSTSGINAPAQWASVAALKLPESAFADWTSAYRRRRDLVLDILGRSGKMKVVPPDGAFYAFVGVEGCLRAGEDSTSFAERLLEAEKVAVVPGTPFGEPRFVRLSFALDERSLQEGCNRIARFAEKAKA